MTPSKGKSPFYPGQPVPAELFAGRDEQIKRIMSRGAGQIAQGKPVAMYVQGEYGIGKSSVAGFTQWLADREYGLHGIYAPIGASESIDSMGAAILEATLRSGAFDQRRSERVRNWLAKYVGEQSLFGVTVHADALKKDAPTLISGLLPFLREVIVRLEDTGVRGVFVVLGEINGIAGNPKFAHFIKSLVDTNAMSKSPVPLLLMLCGVEECRREMIRFHQPVDRIFEVIQIEPMSQSDMETFFKRAFESVQISVKADAMQILTHYSAGFPKIMHLVGDAAFWIDQDAIIDSTDAIQGVFIAAEEVGKKYVDQQVYRALKSADYRSILKKIGKTGLDMSFQKGEIAQQLTDAEKKKFNNFLQKMKQLQVLRSGEVKGEYTFNVRMVRLYIWLQSRYENLKASAQQTTRSRRCAGWLGDCCKLTRPPF